MKMSTLALSYRALRFEILHFGKIPFALGIFFYFALREFLKKFSKIKPSFFYERGLFKARKKRKCDTAELQSQRVIGPKMLKGQHVDVDLLSITVFIP